MKNPKEQYLKRRKYYKNLYKRQSQTINFISILRFIIFIAGIGFAMLFLKSKNYYLSNSILFFTLVLFVIFVRKHSKLKNNKKRVSILCDINEDSIKRLNGEWKSFKDTGEEFIDENHNYSKDLDIFGKSSLFQWINTACTYIGRIKLKEALEVPQKNISEIYSRQEAVKELAANIGWRQRFMAEGILIADESHNPDNLLKWGSEQKEFFTNSLVIMGLRIIPMITMTIVILFFITSNIPYYLPLTVVAIQVLILIPKFNERNRILDTVYRYKDNIKIYNNMLKLIEDKNFNSEYLKELKGNLIDKKKDSSSEQISKLIKIVSLISDRRNMLYFPINILTLWDYQCLIELEKWKKYSGNDLKEWLDTIGTMEELSSLAIIRYNHPEWAIPEIQESGIIFKSEQMGHPLLSNTRVCNNLSMEKQQSVLLITGSNMSGKSTLLRTTGINLVLAYAGAPVCANNFCSSLMNIYTCMRISDNIEKRISSFYAEILRIKKIVKAVDNNETVFFLLDEIFRGTNSKDRHTGAKILINKMSNEKALGLVSTHDFELCDIEGVNKKVKNYHFQEYYKNNEIYFDYKLRSGSSTTRNALYLMKMAGIEVDEERVFYGNNN